MALSIFTTELLNSLKYSRVVCREFHISAACASRGYRKFNKLPENKTSCGLLVDLPDYTYLDGRPTPIGARQFTRLEKQRKLAEKIVQLTGEVDFAKERYRNKLAEEEAAKKMILTRKLKDKGVALLKKSKSK